MEWVETTGQTVADALDAALDELGVHEDDVEVEVLEEPKAGFFKRFGGSDARVRVRLKPISREKPGDRRRRKSKGGEVARAATAADAATARVAARASPAARTGPGARASRAASRKPRGEPSRREPKPPRPKARRAQAESGPRPRAVADGGRTAEPKTSPAKGNEMEEIDSHRSSARPRPRSSSPPGWSRRSAPRAAVTDEIDDGAITVKIDGDDLGLLVGPKGATLNAIEELVRAVVQRETGGHGARIHVDVAGYRVKRREALAAFTRTLVDKVLETGEDQVLEPMHSADRKVVHDTVDRDRRRRDQLGGRGSPPVRGDPPELTMDERRELLGVLEDAQERGLIGPGPARRAPRALARLGRGDRRRPRSRSSTSGSGGGVPGLPLLVEWPDALGDAAGLPAEVRGVDRGRDRAPRAGRSRVTRARGPGRSGRPGSGAPGVVPAGGRPRVRGAGGDRGVRRGLRRGRRDG